MAKKDCHVGIRLTASERERLQHVAQAAGLSTSEYVRRRALRARDGPTISVDVEELRRVYVLLRRASNNANQIARALNALGRKGASDDEAKRALEGLTEASESVACFIAACQDAI